MKRGVLHFGKHLEYEEGRKSVMTSGHLPKKVSVLYAPGTNCEVETMEAFRLSGGKPELVFLEDLRAGKRKITDCDAFCIPGGFSFGDYIGPGAAVSALLNDIFPSFVEARIPVIGICNGFQVLMRMRVFGPGVTLSRNDSGVFSSQPVDHCVKPSPCVWTRGLECRTLGFPAAHLGGKIEGNLVGISVVMEYSEESPNGGRTAGICSPDGLIFGLMDHPERPYGNREGLEIFRRGLAAA